MTPYSIALYLHVVGALLLFAALTVEGIALRLLFRATTSSEARLSMSLLRVNRFIGPVSGLTVLLPGLYMTSTTWGWKGWIVAGLTGWLLVAVLGAAGGIALAPVERRLNDGPGPVPGEVADRIRSPLLAASWRTRVGVVIGIVGAMTLKPDLITSALLIAVAAGIGLATSLPAFTRRGQPAEPRGRARQGETV